MKSFEQRCKEMNERHAAKVAANKVWFDDQCKANKENFDTIAAANRKEFDEYCAKVDADFEEQRVAAATEEASTDTTETVTAYTDHGFDAHSQFNRDVQTTLHIQNQTNQQNLNTQMIVHQHVQFHHHNL